MSLNPENSSMMPKIRLRSIYVPVLVCFLAATARSLEISSETEFDKVQLESESSLLELTNEFSEQATKQDFHGQNRYRRDSIGSGDGENTSDNESQSTLTPNMTNFPMTGSYDKDDNIEITNTSSTSSDFTSTTDMTHPTTMDTCKDLCENAVQNLTATCYESSAYIQFARPSTNYTISNYTLQVNNESFYKIMDNGDNWLFYNITNLSSSTLYEFMINAEFENGSNLYGPVACNTTFENNELNWFTIAGCGISIFWLIVSLICFCFIRNIHGPRNSFHVNLCVNLLIADGTILASVFYESQLKSTGADNVFGIPCYVMPIVVHYFYLTSLMWTGLEILYIYRSLVVVYIKPNNPMLISHLIGYFLPAFVIAFCLLLNYTYFNLGNIYGTDKSCWRAGSNEVALMLLAFVLLILLFNIIILILSSKAISSIKMRQDSQFMVIIANRSRAWLYHLMILHVFLGGSWLLGFLQFGQWKIIPLIFAVFVSLQSFAIFLMHCVLDSCTQHQYRREHCSPSKTTEMQDYSAHVDHISVPTVTSNESDCATLPPPYTLVITGDGIPYEHQDLLPKKRRSLKGSKYSWNVGPSRASVKTDYNTSPTQFSGATFKPTGETTLIFL